MRPLSRKKTVALGVVLLALFLVLWATVIEPRRLVVHEETIALPNWPHEQPPLKVALLSDLHVGSPGWGLGRLAALVERVNELRPDVVILAGDYTINGVLFGTHVDQEPIAKVLGGLRAPHGVLAVLGNHDWVNGAERTRKALEANGIVVLDNEVRTFEHEGFPVNVAGLGDFAEGVARPVQTFAKAGPGPIIGVIHEPDVFPLLPRSAAILLAGHTHGGQVRLPLLGRPVVPSDYGQRYAAGHVVENGRHLFVTTGIGTSIYPIRFGVPPEIALLVLRGN